MKIKFCGAAQNVTGSQHLITLNGKKILLDCGMFQGKREESFKMNRHFIYEPSDIDAVILSHAHIDHAGNLPTLKTKGFEGNIYCTNATRDLCSIMLQDSAYIQEKDVEFVNKKRAKQHLPLFNPLYKIQDAVAVLKQFRSFDYEQSFAPDAVKEELSVKFTDAGHILGSAQVVLTVNQNGKEIKIGYTGDLGRKNLPILKDPGFMGDVDYLLMESTYGARLHENAEMMESELIAALQEAVAMKAKIIVPSFSVGRTQELIYEITKLFDKKIIPEFPVFVDSPLTVNATEIFKLHPECFDTETSTLLANGVNVFGLDNVLYIKDVEESKKLNAVKGPCMIVSASGMCEAGRILHHLANNIDNPNTMIIVIGYMAQNTLGRRIVDLKDTPGSKVKIFGEEHKLNSKVRVLNAFSAHADQKELIDNVKLFDKNKLKKIFLVHGENSQQLTLKDVLAQNGYNNVFIPALGDEFELN
ncbi:MAG TPA: MBL fold metallo-hydrolase [Ignavibacteria bacterium]|nr:MBL fold metallo-hydrolase [Ignavibacteria bacterium]